MNWIAKLFAGGNPIKDAGEAIDSIFTSDEERLQAKAVLVKLEGEFEQALQAQFTERWKADMASDSLLSKNIRPATWALTTILLVACIAASPWKSLPDPAWTLLTTAWVTITGLYVPAREIGKGIVNWRKNDVK